MPPSMTPRPRVAAIGLHKKQIESIAPICGDLRAADSLDSYLNDYSWTETDITILGDGASVTRYVRGHVLTVNPSTVSFGQGHSDSHQSAEWVEYPWTPTPLPSESCKSPMPCPERYKNPADRVDSASCDEPKIHSRCLIAPHSYSSQDKVSVPWFETTSQLSVGCKSIPLIRTSALAKKFRSPW